jgi:hypothetical protein
MLFVLAFVLGAALPAWVSLLLVVPVSMALGSTGLLLPMQSLGGSDLQAYDVVMVVAAFKVAGAALLHGGELVLSRVQARLLAFLAVLGAATLVAGLRFGAGFFAAEITPLLRFAVQALAVALCLPQTLQRAHFPWVNRSLELLGYLMALPILAGTFLLGSGQALGEVHGARTFGFVGDSVGFVLVFYVLWHILGGRYLRALFFALAILATGTRGALLAVVAGIAVLALQRDALGLRVKLRAVILGPVVLVVVLLATDLGGSRTRLFGGAEGRGSNLSQRVLTQRLGVEVFAESPLVGVGYTGFRAKSLEHHAVQRFLHQLGGYAPNFTTNTSNQLLQTATDAGVPGLLVLLFLFHGLLRTLLDAGRRAPPESAGLLLAGYFWLWSLILGNQAAAWLLPGSYISYLLWILLAVAIVAGRAAHPPDAPRARPLPEDQPQPQAL